MALEKIGRYEVKDTLGRGGMATVYAAYDPRFERNVAVKVLPQALLHDPQFRVRFEREAKTIALLEHHAIVPVYDFGEEDGQPYIVMRLMSGGSLADRLKESPIERDEAINIVTRLADALDVAHNKGIIHRDLKPGNILFDQYGSAYLSDFGIARLTGSGATLTGSAIIGTPAYMSPEQIQGDQEIDGRSDIYSLGVILFQMLTNQTPYEGDTPAKIMMMHILEPVPKASEQEPKLVPGFDSVISNAMAKDPKARYQTARAMALDLKRALQAGQSAAPATQVISSSPETVVTSVPPPPATKVSSTAAPPPATTPSPVPTPVPPPPIVQTAAAGTQVRESQTQAGSATMESELVIPPRERSGINFQMILGIIFIIIILGGGSLFIAGRGGTGPLAFIAGDPSTPTPTAEGSFPPTATPAPPTDEPTEAPVVAGEPSSTPEPTQPPTTNPEPTEEPTITPTPTTAAPVLGGADKVAFVHQSDIWIVNLDGTDLKRLTVDGGEKSNLHWTPDGQHVAYIVGKCLKMVDWETEREEIIACFEVAEFLEGVEISPDGERIAISLNRELWILPFDRDKLAAARFRSDLLAMGDCEVLNPYTKNAVKAVHWGDDGTGMAFVFLGAVDGLRNDIIRITEVSSCSFDPPRLDEFPGTRFEMKGYRNAPVIENFGWDGQLLFALNGFIRNGGFGDLYIYNGDTRKGELVNPVGGACCYRDTRWSPDGRYLTFAFQDIGQGANSVAEIYVIPFGTLGTGIDYVPIPLPDDFLTDPKEAPQPILRPIVPQ